MSAVPMAITAQDVAKGLSMFEIDESLEALVEAAEQEAEANNGEISEDIKTALATYAEAFGYKVDRIANYLKAQKAEAELAQREAERFQARHKAAENREKRLKQMLVWFMISRNTPEVAGFPEYDQPAGQQRAVADDPGDYAHSRQLLPGEGGTHVARVA